MKMPNLRTLSIVVGFFVLTASLACFLFGKVVTFLLFVAVMFLVAMFGRMFVGKLDKEGDLPLATNKAVLLCGLLCLFLLVLWWPELVFGLAVFAGVALVAWRRN